MKIRLASDLHLEGFAQMDYLKLESRFLPPHPEDGESILILAGDISSRVHQLISFLEIVEKRFKLVLFVPGNHEFYGHDMVEWKKTFVYETTKRLNNTFYSTLTPASITLEDTTFILTTLWAYGGSTLREEMDVEYGLYDFSRITYSGSRFTVQMMQDIYKYNVSSLQKKLSSVTTSKTVVVTHHMPSLELCHPRFGTSLNAGFASPLEHLLEGVDVWCHGHTHDTIDRIIGNTRIVANPAGYRTETNSSEYNNYKPFFLSI